MHIRRLPMHRGYGHLDSQILAIVATLILSIGVPAYLYEATGGPDNVLNPWWSLLIIGISGACYAGIIASRRRQLFGMVFWLFTYIFMGLAPYVQYRLDILPSTVNATDKSYFPMTGILILASIIVAIVGSRLASSGKNVTQLRRQHVDYRRANALAIFAFALFAYYGHSIGFGSFILSRSEVSAVRDQVWPNSAQSALLTGSMHMSLLVAFISQMTLRAQARLSGRKPPWLLPAATGLVLLYAVNPVGSSRTLVGTVALAMLASMGAYASVKRYRLMAVIALFGMLVIFPAASLFRHTTNATLEFEGPVTALTSGDFDAFAQVATTLDYVDHQGITYGGQFLGALLFWVPRSVWPQKPMDTGVVLGEYMNYGFTNLSAPIWSELYINFGALGTICGLGALGYLFRRWDISADLSLNSLRVPPVGVCAVVFYLLIVLRGSLLNAVSYLLVILLATWFVSGKRLHGSTYRRSRIFSNRRYYTAHQSTLGASKGSTKEDRRAVEAM